MSDARYWFHLWSVLTGASEAAAEQLKPYSALYRRKAVRAAYLLLEEAQRLARVKLAAIGVGLLTAGGGWVWLSVTAYTGGGWYAVVLATLFLLNAVATAPAAAFTGNPWRRLGVLAVFWAALSVGLLASDGWPRLDLWQQQSPDLLQIFVFATGSIALFCLLGTLLARLAFFACDVIVERRRTRKYPETIALFQTVGMIDLLSKGNGIGDLLSRRDLIWGLDAVADFIDDHIPRIFTVRGYNLPEEARVRFDQAASAVRGYQAQVALPNGDTSQNLRARLAELAVPLVTGHYDLLPTSDAAAKSPASLARRPARLLVGVLAGVLPLAIVAVYPLLGFSLPDYLRQWLAGFAVVWLIAKTLQMVDPLHGSTWDRVHTALNSPRPPSDKP